MGGWGLGWGRLLQLESGMLIKSFNVQKSPITEKLPHPNVNKEILAYRNDKELDYIH